MKLASVLIIVLLALVGCTAADVTTDATHDDKMDLEYQINANLEDCRVNMLVNQKQVELKTGTTTIFSIDHSDKDKFIGQFPDNFVLENENVIDVEITECGGGYFPVEIVVSDRTSDFVLAIIQNVREDAMHSFTLPTQAPYISVVDSSGVVLQDTPSRSAVVFTINGEQQLQVSPMNKYAKLPVLAAGSYTLNFDVVGDDKPKIRVVVGDQTYDLDLSTSSELTIEV